MNTPTPVPLLTYEPRRPLPPAPGWPAYCWWAVIQHTGEVRSSDDWTHYPIRQIGVVLGQAVSYAFESR
jgi:hypothetical protein